MDASRSVGPIPVPWNTTSYPSRSRGKSERLVGLSGTKSWISLPSTAVTAVGGGAWPGGASPVAPAFWSTIRAVEMIRSTSVLLSSGFKTFLAEEGGCKRLLGAIMVALDSLSAAAEVYDYP